MALWLILIVIGFLFALVGFEMAKKRGRDPVVWASICALTGLVGVIVLSALGDSESKYDNLDIDDYTYRMPGNRPLLDDLQSTAKSYDVKKWQALLEVDDDVAIAAETVRKFGETHVDDLADKYLALNDKSYLPKLVSNILKRANVASEDAARTEPNISNITEKPLENGVYWGVRWVSLPTGRIQGEFADGEREFASKFDFETFVKGEWRKSNT